MARTFNGTSAQIAFGSGAGINDLSPFTAFALVRPTANITDARQILTKMNGSYVGKMYIAALGTNQVGIVVSAGSNVYGWSNNNALTVNAWNAVVTQFVGVGAPPNIYVGVLGAAPSFNLGSYSAGVGSVVSDAGATLRIASRDPGDATFFAGGIAECALWDRLLTLDEITALGLGFSPQFFTQNLAFYCPVDGVSSPETSLFWGVNGTVTDTSFLDHPLGMIRPVQSMTARAGSTPPAAPALIARGIGRAFRSITRSL